MNPRARQSLVGGVLFGVLLLISIVWLLGQSPGLSARVAVSLILITVVASALAAALFLRLHVRVEKSRAFLVNAIHYDWRGSMLVVGRPENPDEAPAPSRRLRGSFPIFVFAFLFYFAVMLVLLYGLGGQVFSDPIRLMVAAFLGTSVVHLSGRTPARDPTRLAAFVVDFLAPLGAIVGLLVFFVIAGSNPAAWMMLQAIQYGPLVLVFFLAYWGLDAALEWRTTAHGSKTEKRQHTDENDATGILVSHDESSSAPRSGDATVGGIARLTQEDSRPSKKFSTGSEKPDRRTMKTLWRAVKLLAIGLGLLGIAVIGPIPSPATATNLRGVLTLLAQVLGVLTGALLVAYVFWANATRGHFDEYAHSVIPKLRDAMREMKADKVIYSSAVLLVGTRVERDVSQPYAPRGLPLLLPGREGDDWRILVDGFLDLQSQVFRRASRLVLGTLAFFSGVLLTTAFSVGRAEAIVSTAAWIATSTFVVYAVCFIWLIEVMRLLLRPGGAITVLIHRREANGTITWSTPEFF